MDDSTFWNLIELIDREQVDLERCDLGVAPLVDRLSQLPKESIKAFHESLALKLYALDSGMRFAHSCRSDDGFLYQRCYMVAQGEAAYAKAIEDPRFVCARLSWCEGLLHAASYAWEKTQVEPFEYESSVSFETGSNKKLWTAPK